MGLFTACFGGRQVRGRARGASLGTWMIKLPRVQASSQGPWGPGKREQAGEVSSRGLHMGLA